MYIQRILRNAVLAELLLFLMVANCAPSGPREDGAVQGLGADPSAARLPRHRHKAVASSTSLSSPSSSPSSSLLQSPPSGFQRTYRWSTACSVKQQTAATGGGDLLRFLPGSLVDARGVATDPDTEIRLISAGFDGKVWIFSPSRKRYLCFNKKGKLVTKKTTSGVDERLCQFYDTLKHGNRRFVSAYRPGQQQQNQESSQRQLPWPVPLPGLRDSAQRHLSASSPSLNRAEGGVWQIGFGRTGEALKGSAWRSAKHSVCFDMVDHVYHVRESIAPLGERDMFEIFQSEKSATTVKPRPTVVASSLVTGKKKTRKNNNTSSSVVVIKNSKKKNSDVIRKLKVVQVPTTTTTTTTTTTMAPVTSGNHKSHSQQQQAKQRTFVNENQRVVRRKSTTTFTTTTTEAPLTLPAELLLRLDNSDVENVLDDVDFDSYLAETEQLLAQVAPHHQHHSSSSSSSSSDAVAKGGTHSAFILLDSGGWQEVVVDVASPPPPPASLLDQEQDLISS